MEALEKEKREMQEALNKQDIKMLKEQEVLSKFVLVTSFECFTNSIIFIKVANFASHICCQIVQYNQGCSQGVGMPPPWALWHVTT